MKTITKEEALVLYKSKLSITAQADYDRWPEARGMYRQLVELSNIAGVSAEQFVKDFDSAPIDNAGGRWS
jgi:hypothetical protein